MSYYVLQLEREITFRDAEITRLRKADVNSRVAFARRSLGLVSPTDSDFCQCACLSSSNGSTSPSHRHTGAAFT